MKAKWLKSKSDYAERHFAVSPGQANLTVRPSGNRNRVVGDTLTMTCEAAVGTVHANTEVSTVPRITLRTGYLVLYCAQKETHIFNVAISNELFD